MTEYRLAAFSSDQQEAAKTNSGGYCQGCGVYLIRTSHFRPWALLWGGEKKSHPNAWQMAEARDYPEGTYVEIVARERPSRTWAPFEADHIVPLWSVDRTRPWDEIKHFWSAQNLQALCIPCHRQKTNREAAERARRKREARQPSLLCEAA